MRVSIGGQALPLQNRAYPPLFDGDFSGAAAVAEMGASGYDQRDNLYWARQALYGKELLIEIAAE